MSRLTDGPVPQFHKEFSAALRRSGLGLTPQEGQAVQQSVDDAYLSARGMPMHFEMLTSDRPDWALGGESLPLRYGDKLLDPDAQQWIGSAPPGSVLLRSRPLQYDLTRQNLLSFSNTPAEGMHLLPGSTHVAVGFADLSELAAAVCRWGPAAGVVPGAAAGQLAAFPLEFDRQVQDWCAMLEVVMDQETQKVFDMTAAAVEAEEQGLDSSFEGEKLGMIAAPLLWVGYAASAYAVAKSAVLVEMMMQGADDGAVLQVRYSSAWSHDTKTAFMAALSVLLDEHRGGDHPSVVGMLCHWRSHHDVSLAASRSAWLDSVSKTKADIGGLKRKEHRLAYMHYIFTAANSRGDNWGQCLEFLKLLVQQLEFHVMAQRCSAAATLHYLHSMNWVRDVKGASHLDLLVYKFAALDAGDVAAAEAMEEGVLTAFAHGSAIAHSSIKEVGADELLLTLPMVENARNIIDLCLQRGCFQPHYSPFYRVHTTVYAAFIQYAADSA
ncbi:hypothetical protein COO60DRAFT_1636661 [Scenedesmus sp. NREL 46B-D3]|nr:hypothetical protein COO60DRAFT_1636661 [Scenedesmus sp. NREL 46B-D3]